LKIDLATFRLPTPDVIKSFGKVYFHAGSWPPPKVCKGELVVIVGYPGVHRRYVGENLQISMDVIADPVTTVLQGYFTLADEEQERTLVKVDETLGELGSFGGMSGSAAYVIAENQSPRLVGFLHEAQDSLHGQIRVSHAALVHADGQLDYSAVF
jgi:hypothetical protein